MTPLPLDALDCPPELVRERFAWAARQGGIRWLWPRLSREDWQTALVQIETASRQILAVGAAREPLTGCSEAMGIAAFTSGMGPLLGWWARHGRLEGDAPVLAVLELHLRHNALRMERLAGHAREAAVALGDAGVGVIVLKGMETAFSLFPDPAARALSDIDLLIDPANLAPAAQVLRALGYVRGEVASYEQTWRLPSAAGAPRSLSLMHCENPWSIDLHVTLDRRYAPGSPMIAIDAPLRRSPLAPWSLAPAARVFGPAAMALHLACHADCGFENLTMLRMAELALLLRKCRADATFDVDQFLALAEQGGALAAAFPALHFTEMLAPGSVPPRLLEASGRSAPAAVLRFVRRLRPATAQRVLRSSLEERFLWTGSGLAAARQLARDVLFPSASPARLLAIYRFRLWRLARARQRWSAGGGS